MLSLATMTTILLTAVHVSEAMSIGHENPGSVSPTSKASPTGTVLYNSSLEWSARDAKQLKSPGFSANTNTSQKQSTSASSNPKSSDRFDYNADSSDFALQDDSVDSRSSLNNKLLNLERAAWNGYGYPNQLPYYFYGPKLRRANANEVVADVPTALVPTSAVPNPGVGVINPALLAPGPLLPGFYNG